MNYRQYMLYPLLIVSLPAYSTEINKEDWMKEMTTLLPVIFCQSDQYFRQCFNVSAEKCEEAAASATRVCMGKYADQIPEILVQPKDGTHWGTELGNCAGVAYEYALVKQRKSEDICNDASHWQ